MRLLARVLFPGLGLSVSFLAGRFPFSGGPSAAITQENFNGRRPNAGGAREARAGPAAGQVVAGSAFRFRAARWSSRARLWADGVHARGRGRRREGGRLREAEGTARAATEVTLAVLGARRYAARLWSRFQMPIIKLILTKMSFYLLCQEIQECLEKFALGITSSDPRTS